MRKTTTTTTAASTAKTTQLNFKNTPPQSLAGISILKSQLDFKYNSTTSNDFLSSQYSSFRPKKIESITLEENNCTSSSMTTDEEQQQKRESNHDQDINLDLTIGLAPATKRESTPTSSSNSAESRLQQPVSSSQLYGGESTRPVCLCWQFGGERREMCRDCQNQSLYHRSYC
ncbi:hypothetical protein OIU84_027132 [Salix udensis]|uniref:Uncharacterized protein n=1 Tax=Salix udensis TaxID=889485 RepID=A0AAD6PA10_9ROSI|nr:hypothetical protein OIU84_027132 [Salix udensis]